MIELNWKNEMIDTDVNISCLFQFGKVLDDFLPEEMVLITALRFTFMNHEHDRYHRSFIELRKSNHQRRHVSSIFNH